MPRFDTSNTAGYSDAELAELNRRYRARLATYEDSNQYDPEHDPHRVKAFRDYAAERVLAEYDTERTGGLS